MLQTFHQYRAYRFLKLYCSAYSKTGKMHVWNFFKWPFFSSSLVCSAVAFYSLPPSHPSNLIYTSCMNGKMLMIIDDLWSERTPLFQGQKCTASVLQCQFIYHNSMHHTAPQVNINAVPEYSNQCRDWNLATSTRPNVDAVKYERSLSVWFILEKTPLKACSSRYSKRPPTVHNVKADKEDDI